MAQWSQGLPLGSTEHCFSFSKNSTSSETVASSTPNRSWLGCEAIGDCCSRIARQKSVENLAYAPAKGASQGDCVGGANEVGCEVTVRASWARW